MNQKASKVGRPSFLENPVRFTLVLEKVDLEWLKAEYNKGLQHVLREVIKDHIRKKVKEDE